MSASGGYIANNFRQGFRAEYLAKFIISAFGPCERISQENDYGIDLIASLMKKEGKAGLVSSTYGVQVKTGDANFVYAGNQLFDWIKAFNIPLLMCRVIREEGRILLYSAWPLHHVVLSGNATKINQIEFIEGFGGENKIIIPTIKDDKATVWMGKPIIDISVNELSDTDHVAEIIETLAEWVDIDAGNYYRRMANIPIVFGYITWETNKSLKTTVRQWDKQFYFTDGNSEKAIKVIQDCAVVIACNKGTENQITKDLSELLLKYIPDLDDFTKKMLGIMK